MNPSSLVTGIELLYCWNRDSVGERVGWGEARLPKLCLKQAVFSEAV